MSAPQARRRPLVWTLRVQVADQGGGGTEDWVVLAVGESGEQGKGRSRLTVSGWMAGKCDVQWVNSSHCWYA